MKSEPTGSLLLYPHKSLPAEIKSLILREMKTLAIEGKNYVTARYAAEITGYEPDYIGQLIRGGKIFGKLVGRSWYVDP